MSVRIRSILPVSRTDGPVVREQRKEVRIRPAPRLGAAGMQAGTDVSRTSGGDGGPRHAAVARDGAAGRAPSL